MVVFVGSRGFVQYGIWNESNNDYDWKNFGVGTKVTSIAVRNNLERIPVLGQRDAGVIVPLKYEGTWGIETYPVDVGTLASDLGWDESVLEPVKFPIQVGIVGGMKRVLNDAIVNRVSISARQGEIVRLTIEGIFKNEEVSNDTSGINFSESTGTPATFADGTVSIDGSDVGLVQSFEMTVNVNPNPIYALGSRYYQDAYLRMLEAEGRMTVVMTDMSWINDAEDVSEHSSVKLNLGAAGSVQLDLAKVNEISHSIEPNEMVIADVTFYARKVTFS